MYQSSLKESSVSGDKPLQETLFSVKRKVRGLWAVANSSLGLSYPMYIYMPFFFCCMKFAVTP